MDFYLYQLKTKGLGSMCQTKSQEPLDSRSIRFCGMAWLTMFYRGKILLQLRYALAIMTNKAE